MNYIYTLSKAGSMVIMSALTQETNSQVCVVCGCVTSDQSSGQPISGQVGWKERVTEGRVSLRCHKA